MVQPSDIGEAVAGAFAHGVSNMAISGAGNPVVLETGGRQIHLDTAFEVTTDMAGVGAIMADAFLSGVRLSPMEINFAMGWLLMGATPPIDPASDALHNLSRAGVIDSGQPARQRRARATR